MIPRSHAITTVSGQADEMTGAAQSASSWLARHAELLWAIALVLLAALAHGYNMFHFPYFESDEGTYMAQAWSLINHRQLAPYTYWYDHAPGGWVQLALWTQITGGMYSLGGPLVTGRLLMFLMQVGAAAMVYAITRRVSGSVIAATIATLAFSLSGYGLYYHRRILLDNIATFWMLASLALLVWPKPSLSRIWLSATALGVSILSKELTIFLVPALACVVACQTKGAQRWIAVIGWVTIVCSLFSLYPLLAFLKGELLPSGATAGGIDSHVSLIGSLAYQSTRERDAGLLSLHSGVWNAIRTWRQEEPLLLVGGLAAMLASLIMLPWRRTLGMVALMALSLWLFIGRGGVTLPFYLVPLLPLQAICLGAVLGMALDALRQGLARMGARAAQAATLGRVAAVAACLWCISLSYHNPHLEFRYDTLSLWRSKQADVHAAAAAWVRANIPHDAKIVIDQSMWLDLHAAPDGQEFPNAHYYWKVSDDPAIRNGVFGGDWRSIDYVITTNQMLGDASRMHDPLLDQALAAAIPLKTFDMGAWPVSVYMMHSPTVSQAASIMRDSWASYRSAFIEGGRVIDRGAGGKTTSEGQSYAMLRAVFIDDRATFDQVWGWTKANLQQPNGLLAWLWDKLPSGEYGVTDRGAASDADQDAALALLFASRRWDEPRYADEARQIMCGIWSDLTVDVRGQRVLAAGAWATAGDPVVNPSYLAPYAYRIFAQADPGTPWDELTESSYQILAQIRSDARFGKGSGTVPNWIALDATTGAIKPAPQFGEYADQFSYDASRTPWRVALDWQWFHDPRAAEALAGMDLPSRAFQRDGKIAAAYNADGGAASPYESISMYSGAIGQLMFSNSPDLATQVYQQKIARAYHTSPAGSYWGEKDNYYDQNWAWFATGLLSHQLENLWAK